MGSLTPRGSPTSHQNDACDVAFDRSESLGTPDHRLFDAQWPCPSVPLPTLRVPLAGTDARLAEKRELVTPSFQRTFTSYLMPVRLAHQIPACALAHEALALGGDNKAPVGPRVPDGGFRSYRPTSRSIADQSV